MRVHLKGAERGLLQIEAENRQRSAAAREAAKASLRLGDHRGYQKAALRYVLASRHAGIAAGWIEVVQGLQEAVETQAGLAEVLAIGDDLEGAMQDLGLEVDRIHRVKAYVRDGMDTVNRAAVSITSTLRSVSWGETTQGDLDSVHEELLAEIERETTANMRVKRELHRDPPGKGSREVDASGDPRHRS